MNGQSLNIAHDNLDKLQMLFPDIFSEGKIDLEKFKATFTDDINFNNERYVLNWAGKANTNNCHIETTTRRINKF
jgi:adenine-specific DNA-methyltransferase